MTQNTHDIASRAMLVYLNVSQWTARKLDKNATAEVAESHDAAADAGRYNKQLIPKEALAPIQKIASEARAYLNMHTLPWSDLGDRALSNTNYFTVMDRLKYYKSEFDAEVDTFCTEYLVHREKARFKLNSLFKESDYPRVEDVRLKFAMNFGVLPLPTAHDFRVTMAADQVDEVRQQIQSELDGRVQAMMSGVKEALIGTVSHLRDRLRSSGKLFDSTLGNVEDLLARIPGLNLTNDAEIESLRAMVAQAFQGMTMKDIKKDEQLRTAVADRADEILRQMQGLM
jgi:hypothetical protein